MLKSSTVLFTGLFLCASQAMATTVSVEVDNEHPTIETYTLKLQVKGSQTDPNEVVAEKTIPLQGVAASTKKTFSVDLGDLEKKVGGDTIYASNIVSILYDDHDTKVAEVYSGASGSMLVKDLQSIALKTNLNEKKFEMNIPPATAWDHGTFQQ